MRAIAILATSLALGVGLAACGGADPESAPEEPAAAGTDEEEATDDPQGSATCDGAGACESCQQCVYAEGGDCEQAVSTCLGNEACLSLNDCMTSCVGSDPTAFDGCLESCADDDPDGEDDYLAVLGCVEGACTADCQF